MGYSISTNRRRVGAIVLAVAVLALWLGRNSSDTPPPATAHSPQPPGCAPAVDVFSAFRATCARIATASPAGQATPADLALARQRRAAMEELIRTEPRKALENALSLREWQLLPSDLQTEVEQPFSSVADLLVLPICNGLPGQPAPEPLRILRIPGQPDAEAHVFGQRAALTTKYHTPVRGIRLGTLAALHEEILPPLDPADLASARAIYPLANPLPDRDFFDGSPLGASPVAALAGGRVFLFANEESRHELDSALAALDSLPDPHSGAASLLQPLAQQASAGFNLELATNATLASNSVWTESKKTVLMIRCDFSDKPNSSYPVIASATYSTLLNGTVSNSIRDYSYGKTWIEATVSSSVIRLPRTSTTYAATSGGSSQNALLMSDAKAAYQTANPAVNMASYDIIGVWFVDIGMQASGITYAGLAGGSEVWFQGATNADVPVHEFGHNYGLGHSSYWTPPAASTNPVDPSGSNDEYGDPFDIMGAGTTAGAYHAEAKQRLNWLATGDWTDATATGSATHRLYRIDHPQTTGVRGLRITRGIDDYYWLCYRRNLANDWLRAGASVMWQRPGQNRSWLIDTTLGSLSGTSDRTDGSLAIGRTYSDGNTHVTVLGRGGTTPNEYLDVRVNFGPFAGNSAPTATITGPSTISARQTAIFSVQASDPNGDTLAYSWDFGQGFTFDNNPSAAFAWTTGGTFTVKVTVSDMKGLTTQATKTVTVTDPLTTWTNRTNTSAGNFTTITASSSKLLAAGEDFTNFKAPVATSSDGVTWSSYQLGLNQHMYGSLWDGSKFILVGMGFASNKWQGLILTSTTGNSGSWTQQLLTGSELRAIAYGGGVYVAVGDLGTIRRSTNGTTWTLVTSGTTNHLTGVTYAGGKFVAVGYDSTNGYGTVSVLTSTDGTTWTSTSSGAGIDYWNDLRYLTAANNTIVASGWYAKLRTSTDSGTTFTSTRTNTEDTPALAYGNGVWFAAGVDKSNSDVDIDLVSTDATNWTPLTTPALDNRRAAIFFNNTFITVGDNHSIRQSGTFTSGASGYLTWRDTYFPNHESTSTPSGDADSDGLGTLLEYAFGTSPTSAPDGRAAVPRPVQSANALFTGRLTINFSLPEPAPAEVSYAVDAASLPEGPWTTLATKAGTGAWTWTAGGTSRILTGTPANNRVSVTIGDSQATSAATRRFLRLRTSVN